MDTHFSSPKPLKSFLLVTVVSLLLVSVTSVVWALAPNSPPTIRHRAIGDALGSSGVQSRQLETVVATSFDSEAYVAIFSDADALYSLALGEKIPQELGRRIAVPQSIIERATTDVYTPSEWSNDIVVTDPYEFFHGLISPDGKKMVYVEASCTDTSCSSDFRVWFVDLRSHERKLLIDDPVPAEALFMNPVQWSEQANLIIFDTFVPTQNIVYNSLWTLDLNTDVLSKLDLGPGDYNSRPHLSPDGRYLLFTGSAETGFPNDQRPRQTKPTNLLKIYDLLTRQATVLLENPVKGEFFLDGWIQNSSLDILLQDIQAATLAQSPSTVPPATSGFQRPMTYDHYGFHWLECTVTNSCPPNVFHPGDDYNGPDLGNADCGTTIYAVANGLVRHVNLGDWGTMVIEHDWQGTTVYSQYGHLASASVSANAQVTKGQAIATMGNTGTATCHLHWEIRESDHPNPQNSGYYATNVLNNIDNVNNYYEDPEWWVDNHGSYTPELQVKLHAQANFGGGVVWIGGTGFSNGPNSNSYSMEIPSGWSVKTWRQDNRGGEERCWSSSVNNLQDHGWQNAIQSIEVFNSNVCSSPPPTGQVELWSLSGYTGSIVWSGGSGLSNGPSANSYSMKIPNGWSVKTWRQDNRGGEERCWSSSVNNLQDHGWQNAIQSIEVFSSNVCSSPPPTGQVELWSLSGFSGSIVWSGGTGFSNGPSANSYSMKVPTGWSAKTWRQDNRSGEERCWSSSVNNLQDHGWHLAIQSIEVFNSNVCPPPAPTADFDAWPLLGNAPLDVAFHNISSGSITSCGWAYGNGATGTSCDGYHNYTYNNPGTYTVQLTVTGLGGSNTKIRTGYIVVNTPPPQVKLWSLANFAGTVVWSNGTGFSNDPSANSYSLQIPSGWSVKTWRGENRTGEERCWASSITNLQDHGWHNSIQSIEVFSSNVCPTVPSAPGNVQASDGTYTDKVRVTWNSSAGATSYEVWRNISNNSGSAVQLNSAIAGTTYDDTAAAANTTYYYWAKAKNAAGTSGFSLPDTGFRAAPPAPNNDDFNSPRLITTTPANMSQDTTGATTAGDDPSFTCVSGQRYNTVWYRYTAPSTGTLIINTFDSSYDTVLAIWTGSRGNLTSITCNDDANNTLQSQVQVAVTSGTTYHIEIAGYYATAYGPLNLAAFFTPSSQQVNLYGQANYAGSIVWSGGTGFSNGPSSNSYSMQVPSGWSVKTWRQDNRGGEERCWATSVNNLQDHGWHNSIQSIEVFSTNVCPPTATPTPTPTPGSSCPAITAWKGEYWNNETLSGSPALCRNDTNIDFEWEDGSPAPQIQADHFSARWTRNLSFSAGTYRFVMFHDDGVRLYVDSSLVFQNWCNDCRETDTVDIPLTAGTHAIRMEMRENGGWASAELSWSHLPTPTPTATPTTSGQTWTWQQEAELGTITNAAHLAIRSASDASACNFVQTVVGGGSGRLEFNLAVPTSGNHWLWARAMGFGWDRNSFWVSIDNEPEFQYEIPQQGNIWTWGWSIVHNENQPEGPLYLSAGNHILRFRSREIDARLDKIILTNHSTFAPGAGNVTPCVQVSPTPTPTRTNTPMPTHTRTPTPNYTLTITPTPTRTPTPTPTSLGGVRRVYVPWVGRQPTPTPTRTPTPTTTPICPQDPYEPNGTFGQAWGPLSLNQDFWGYFNCPSETDRDFYFFDLSSRRQVVVTLQNIPSGSDYDLTIYSCPSGSCLVGYSGNPGTANEYIDMTLNAGRYYVRVTRSLASPLTAQPYKLRVASP